MITFVLNGLKRSFAGDPEESLLDHLRLENRITSAKDGCSGEGTCGACSVLINSQARLACRTRMKELEGSEICTIEGLPERFREVVSRNFALYGAVQCGFCSPGMIIRAVALCNRTETPSRAEIVKAITPNLCRCTGYVKIIDAIEATFSEMNGSPAGGAILVVLANAMIPESYEYGKKLAGIFTVIGFSFSVLIVMIEHLS